MCLNKNFSFIRKILVLFVIILCIGANPLALELLDANEQSYIANNVVGTNVSNDLRQLDHKTW